MIPPAAFSFSTATSTVGVVDKPISITSKPHPINVPETIFDTNKPEILASLPITIFFESFPCEEINFAYAEVNLTISIGVKESPTAPPIVPLIPEIDLISVIIFFILHKIKQITRLLIQYFYLCYIIYQIMIEILKNIPSRASKPREEGLTMVMDKGLSLNEAENMVALKSELTDIVKLGFGTSLLTRFIDKKINLYQKSGMMVYTGGTLFEAFVIRNQFDDFCKLMDKLKLEMVEVSDGSISINHDVKCEYIQKLSKNFKVISEIGSKDESIILDDSQWISFMKKELDAGSWKVIAEAREGGNVGMFDPNGNIKKDLIDKITSDIPVDKILWEAPQKKQQVWFINSFGANVNLGNISPNDIISLECLRLGLRGDTFENYL